MGKTAKIFKNGRSQAVRLPKEYRFDCDEVYVERRGDAIVITAKQPGWDEFFDSASAFGEDYLKDREDLPPQERTHP
jgi:antitoxin VapB